MPHFSYPRIWHIIYADEFTCLEGEQGVLTGILAMSPDYLQYRVQLLNPDALGNPLEHFGDEETGEEHSDNVNPGDIYVFLKKYS